jgi:hypothetical protein
MSAARERLPDRRYVETFGLEIAGLRYTCSVGRFADGRICELFLSHYKSNSAADTNARDGAIALSFTLQHGVDIETICKALCRDSQGLASGPLARAWDMLVEDQL